MTESEKIDLIKAGISYRVEHYERVKQLSDKPLCHIESETGYSRHFITKCRKIAGWKRRKNKIMNNNDLANSLTNALGSQHFDPDMVIEVLYEAAKEIQEKGGNAGSLWAVANILPELTKEAKQRYEK